MKRKPHRIVLNLATLVCDRCGVACEPTRLGWRHSRPRCLAWMPYIRERCQRFTGHRDSHRSWDAVTYDRERKRAA